MFKEIYIIISPKNGQLTQLLLQSDSRQVAMAWSRMEPLAERCCYRYIYLKNHQFDVYL